MESIIKGNQNTTMLCNYLKTAATQYPTLSKAQEKALIEKHKDDREHLNKLLFMHNIRIVFNIAKKYVSKTNDFDGLVQDGMLGLGEAAKRFDITKGIKFITYATIWVRKYILMNFYGKQVDIEKHSVSLNAAMDSDVKSNNETETTFESFVNQYIDPSCYRAKSIDDELSACDRLDIYNDLMSQMESDASLSSTDKSVFKELMCDREKPRDVAEKHSLSVLEVNGIKKRVLGMFKDVLHSKYNINSYSDIAV